MSLPRQLRRLLTDGSLDLPALGAGATPRRLRALVDLGRLDTALARLAEAHVDATQILAEAGRAPRPGALYGVWAAEDPTAPLRLRAGRGDRPDTVIDGTKVFCTGAGIVDRALITVPEPSPVLVEVDLRRDPARIDVDTSAWITPAFAATSTAVVRFTELAVDADAVVGVPGWYLTRPGFWNGACGPAACWAGGATGLVDAAVDRAAGRASEPHRDAALGALSALAAGMDAVLAHAGAAIDRDPDDADAAQVRALQVRHLVERSCTEVIDRFGRAFGPRPLAFDADVQRRILEVQLYVRQSHAERDLESLGAAVRERAAGRAPGTVTPSARDRSGTGPPENSGMVHS